MTKSFWQRPLAELLGGGDALNNAEAKTEQEKANYLQYERILIDLNNSLPADIYFRTRYTTYGYDLYIYSTVARGQYEFHVDVEHGLVLNDDSQILCKLENIKQYLLDSGITTEDTSDDFEHDKFEIDQDVISAITGG